MPTLRSTCILPATQEKLFAFHSHVENLRRVSPPTSRIISMQGDLHAREGGHFTIVVRELGLVPMSWTCRWKAVEPPHMVYDEMIAGPFRVFEHQHCFEHVSPGLTRLTDIVHYEFGRGVPGLLLDHTVIRLYLTMMFAWRRGRMRHLAASGLFLSQDSSP